MESKLGWPRFCVIWPLAVSFCWSFISNECDLCAPDWVRSLAYSLHEINIGRCERNSVCLLLFYRPAYALSRSSALSGILL